MKRIRTTAVVAFCMAILLSACGASTPGAAVPAGPKTDTSNLVVAVTEMAKQDFTPWLVQPGEELVNHLTNETLTRVDNKTGNIGPGLALSWVASADARTWNIKLRPNVPFHDGYGNLTADDVKFSWEQFIQKDSVQGQKGVYSQAVDGDMKNFNVVGPLEFTVTTTKPVVYLPAAMVNVSPGMVIQSKKYWDTKPATETRTRPIGTGPWKFVSSTPAVDVKLEAVANHYRQTAAFKNLTIRIIADDSAKLAAVSSGSVDIAPIAPKLVKEAKATGGNLFAVPDIQGWNGYFGGNYEGHPTAYDPTSPWINAADPAKGLKVRQAISMSFDRKTIIERLFDGSGSVTRSPYWEFPSNPLTTETSLPLPEFNIAKAKQLLAEAGHPNGFPVTVPIQARGDKPGLAEMSEVFAQSFEAIGLKVTRLTGDYNAIILPKLRAKETKGWIYVSSNTQRDVQLALEETWGDKVNISRGMSPKIVDFTARFAKETDVAKRFALVRELNTYGAKELIGIPLFTSASQYAFSGKVGTWQPVPGLQPMSQFEYVTPKVP